MKEQKCINASFLDVGVIYSLKYIINKTAETSAALSFARTTRTERTFVKQLIIVTIHYCATNGLHALASSIERGYAQFSYDVN